MTLIKEIRDMRDALLAKCDWTQMSDCPLSDDEKNIYKIYRQALRDIPQHLDGITEFSQVIWPEEP